MNIFLYSTFIFFVLPATWYKVDYNETSWEQATSSNTNCIPDPYGNYISLAACKATLPQPQFPPCPHCAVFADIDLIVNYETWYKKLWGETYQYFGFVSSKVDPLWSPLQIAKLWIVGTLKNSTTPIVPKSPKYSSGGPTSCVNALTVGLQEGGTTGVDGTVTYPYNDGAPRNIFDPAWNLGSSLSALCAPIGGSTSDQCISGSIWQTSNAWVGNTCDACNHVGCQSLQNPLCTVRVTFEFALMVTREDPCRGLLQNGATECTPVQYHQRIDPKCFNGPFCLGTNGWNSPACYQIFRQVYPNEGSPYCRLAIEACQLAREQLLVAYQKAVQDHPNLMNDMKILQGSDTTNQGIESICPANPGNYATTPPQCS